MQTTAQNVSSIRMGSGVLKVAGVNVGLLNAAKLETTFNVLSIAADNGKLPAYKKIEAAVFSAELYEVYLPNIQAIDTHGVLTAVAASPVAVATEIILAASSGAVAKGAVYVLTNKNGNDAIVTSVTVDVDGTPLTLNTDYTLKVDSTGTVTGRKGASYITFLDATTTNKQVDVDYTYTPNASRTITYSDVAKLVGYYEVTFENTDSNGKKFSITFPAGYSTSDLTMEFKSDASIDEAMTVPFAVTAYPNGSNVLFTIVDEQAA